MLEGVPRGALPIGDSAPHSAGRKEEHGDTLTPLFVVDGRPISLESADGSTLLRWLRRRRSITIVRAGNDTGYAGHRSSSSTTAVGVTMSTFLIDSISSRSASPARRAAPPSTAASRNMSWTDQGEKVTVAQRSEDDTRCSARPYQPADGDVAAASGSSPVTTMSSGCAPDGTELSTAWRTSRTTRNFGTSRPDRSRRPSPSSISMARYRVEISRTAERQLKQLPPEDRQRVARAVVEKTKLIVLVPRIGHRKNVYR